MNRKRTWKRVVLAACLSGLLVLALAGCPYPATPAPTTPYDKGFDDGFLRDDWYWTGFFDSYDTTDYAPLYYQGSDIPQLNDNSYDAGYYDGIWYAYNDGYFTDYRYAFIVGFSEGYDAAYYPDYLTFLANDQHIENANGGWGDGYNDGFSEGRIFGAADYESGWTFDWLNAFLDYESGTDLYFQEIDLGTGSYGPVEIYQYGVDPATLKSAAAARGNTHLEIPTLRRSGDKKVDLQNRDLYRPIRSDAKADLNVDVTQVPRNPHDVRYTNTRYDRIELYLNGATSSSGKSSVEQGPRPRAVAK